MEIGGILRHWNVQYGSRLPLTEGVLDATFFSWLPENIFLTELRSGWLFCKLDSEKLRVHWAVPRGVEAVDDFCDESSAFLREEAGKRGLKQVVFGGGEDHLFPGIPLETPAATPDADPQNPWLLHFTPTGPVVMDFQGPIETLLDRARAIEAGGTLRAPVSDDEKTRLIEFVSKEFPGRWTREIIRDAGNNQLEHYFAYELENEITGYVRLYGWSPSYYAPGVYFAGPETRQGGLGPVGVARSKRKRGLGSQILKKSWEKLQSKGISKVRVDWTTETTFYLERGLEIVQCYQPAVMEV